MFKLKKGKCSLLCLFLSIIRGVCGAEETSVSVTEGDSLILHSDFTETLTDQILVWMFGDQETRIAEINWQTIRIFNKTDQFRDRLMMDSKTGSLTITNIRTEDAGLYKLMIFSDKTSHKRFRVSVVARLPVPVIIRRNSCSSSVCEVVCSVENVRNVTLSWYKGESLISSISVSDLSRRVSLPLEIESLNDSYVCVLNNTITQQNTHLNVAHLCQICSDKSSVSKQTVVSAAVVSVIVTGFLMLMFFFCWRRRSITHKAENISTPSEQQEVIYAETVCAPGGTKQKKTNGRDETIYSSVMHVDVSSETGDPSRQDVS